MLVETYEYTIKNRNRLLRAIDFGENNDLFRSAKQRWIDCKQPERVEKEDRIAAIDSSWNYLKYHGYYLYAVDAVSIFANGNYAVEPRYQVGIDTLGTEDRKSGKVFTNPLLYLSSIGMDYEYQLALESIEKCDYALIDGSLLARYYDRREGRNVEFYQYAIKLMKMKEKSVIFAAKSSESNVMLNGSVGDIYYFSKATEKAGYSSPHFDQAGITVFYARLDDYQPCIKVEVPEKLDERECKDIFYAIGAKRFNGYPYQLRLAHETCKIADDDMENLASVLGLEVETSAREVLNE